MIGSIRKHSTWLWAIIIVVTVASFVVFYRPGGRGNDRSGNRNYGKIGDQFINQTDYVNAHNETGLRFFISNGQWPDRAAKQSGFDWERETYFRLFLIHKMEDLHIAADPESVALTAREILSSLNRGQMMPLAAFEKQVLQPQGMSLEDFERTIRHDMGLRQLFLLAGGSGDLLTPQEARMLYIRENAEISAQAVFFSASNYLSGVTVTPEMISQFYTNQMAAYRLPDRVQVNYVEFLLTNYWAAAAEEIAKITNMDQQFDMYTLENGTNYFGHAHNAEEARVKFKDAYHKQEAGSLATKAANAFAVELFDLKPVTPDNLNKLAKEKNLTVKTTEPFDNQLGPKEFAVPLHFAQVAFRLSADEPFAAPVAGETAVYVMALNKRLPSEVPSLESIHAEVVSDYTRAMTIQLARKATVVFFTAVTNGLAHSNAFPVICMEAHAPPVMLPKFSLATRELPELEKQLDLNTLKQAAFSVLPGKANYTGTADGGVVLFVNSRLPVDEAEMNRRMPQFIASVHQAREQETFNRWFSAEAQQDPGVREILEMLSKRDQPNTGKMP